jgi:hypothetical protein
MDRIVFKDDLPTFNEYLKDDEKADAPAPRNRPEKKRPQKDKELKQNLGSLLKDFKVNSEDS